MKNDRNSGFQAAPVKPSSFDIQLLGWVKARLRDVMIAAEVLHDVQFAAPWLDCQPPHSPSQQPNGHICC
jgi:hypothetical protein